MTTRWPRVVFAIASTACALPATAQTNDHLFRSWRWTEEIEAPRAAGLAGAFVAVADDSSATVLNPAGIMLLPKTELAATMAASASGTISPIGDRQDSRTDPGFIGGAGLIAKRLAIGAYLNRAHHDHVVLDSAIPALAEETGFLDVAVTDAGAALAWQPMRRVYVGGRLNVRHLSLEGLWSSPPIVQPQFRSQAIQVGLNAGADRLTVDAGVLVQLTDALRFGLAHRQGASWEVNRLATNPTLKLPLDSRPTQFRSPSAFSSGLAWHVNPQVMLTAQVDYVLYGQLQSSLDIRHGAFARDDYQLRNAFEARMGVELSRRLGAVSLQLRGGIYSQAPGQLRYVGDDQGESLAFPPTTRRTLVATGLSVISRLGLRFDSSLQYQGEGLRMAVGLALRF